jgi:hypothetical protein
VETKKVRQPASYSARIALASADPVAVGLDRRPAGTPARSSSQRQLCWSAALSSVKRSGRCIGAGLAAAACGVEFSLRLFPVPAVETLDRELDRLVEAVRALTLHESGMGSRLVEALHSAVSAEEMLGCARAEAIAGQGVATGDQLEFLVRNNDVNKPLIGRSSNCMTSAGTGGSGSSASNRTVWQ